MNLLECFLTENKCYKAHATIIPKGVMVHSTGANNPMIKRYVEPEPGQENYTKLINLLGDNIYDNDWNHTTRDVCVHAFIGKLADGSVASVQTLPWYYRGWHAGSGKNGSANDTHISFEICEDGLADKQYFDSVYKEAVELTAYLCKQYKLDPLADGVVICHSEGSNRGIASNHSDVMHWFPKHGKSMDTFRADVSALLVEPQKDTEWERFNMLMNRWLLEQASYNPAEWSKDARTWAESNGIINGDSNGQKRYKSYCTREEIAQILYRLHSK